MKIDLHLHTTASDGTNGPVELMRKLKRLSFTHVAITDHDTCEGCVEAVEAGEHLGVKVIVGIELSADAGIEVHVLGYGIHNTDQVKKMTASLKEDREERMLRIVRKLNDIGVRVTADEVRRIAPGAPGRVHIARVLVEKKYAMNIKVAFSQYLSPGRAAYFPRTKMRVCEAVQWIAGQGGVAVLAHPGLIEMDESELKGFVKRLKGSGLSGVEAYHPGHTDRQCLKFDKLSRELKLCVTGGSDYHGENKAIEPGFRLERWKKMEEDFIDIYQKIPRIEHNYDV